MSSASRVRAGARKPGGSDFAAGLAGRYRERLAGETLMVNELYVALLYRPSASAAVGLAARLLVRARPGNRRLETAAGLDVCAKLGADAGGLAGAL